MSHLGQPYKLKGLELKNRIVMAPMCQYSVHTMDGIPNDWHYIHYVSRAIGGTGLIIMEMTDVEPDGRISNLDLGLWSDEHVPAFRRIIDAIHAQGAKAGVQIAHAGRKARDAEVPVSCTDEPYSPDYKKPRMLSTEETWQIIEKFADAARRAAEAGFDTIELHAAHGYLIHQFQSPCINKRTDEFGTDYSKFGVEVIRAVKKVIPQDMPITMRISAVEYAEGGYGLEHALQLCRAYRDAGVDLFDVSSGGESGLPPARKPGNYPGYQLPFARAIKQELDVPVIAVGMLEDVKLAEHAIASGDADLVALGRGLLRNPYWPTCALRQLDGQVDVPEQYRRAYL